MKKMKKLLSALTALAITASAFAGLAIPVNAADNSVDITQNFDGEITNGADYTWDVTAAVDWVKNSTNKGISLTTNSKKTILAFTNGVGGLSKDINFSFDVGAVKGFGQDPTTWNVIFKAKDGTELFRLSFKAGLWSQTISLAAGDKTEVTNYTFAEGKYTAASGSIVFAPTGGEVTFGNKTLPFAAGSDLGSIYVEKADSVSDQGRPYYIDNLVIKSADKPKTTFTITSAENGKSVEGAELTIDDKNVYAVPSTGIVDTYYAAGKHTYQIKLAEHKKATGEFTVVAATDGTKDVELEYVGAPVATKVVISGGSESLFLPANGSVTSEAFVGTVFDQAELEMKENATVKWSLPGANSAITIDEDTGVVTLTSALELNDDNGTDITVRATVEGTSVTADTSLHIYNTPRATYFDMVGPYAIKDGTQATFSIDNLKDQYKFDFKGDAPEVVLTSTDDKAEIDGLKITPHVGTSRIQDVTVTIALKNDPTKSVERTVAVYGYDFYEPGVDALSETATNVRFETVGDKKLLNWPKGKTETVITLPTPVDLSKAGAKMITFDNTVIKQGASAQERSLQIRNSKGENIINIDFAGGTGAQKVLTDWSPVTTTDSAGKKNVNYEGTEIGETNKLGESSSALFILKTDSQGVTSATLSYNGKTLQEYVISTTDDEGKTSPMAVGDIASIRLYSGEGIPDDRQISISNIVIGDSDVAEVEISGDDKIAKIKDHVAQKTFRGAIFSQDEGETFTWSVADGSGNAINGVSIDQNGVLSVDDTVPADTVAVISYTSSKSTQDNPKLATHNVTIKDFAAVASFEVVGPVAVNAGDTVSYSVRDVVDEYGDKVTMPVSYEIVEGSPEIASLEISGEEVPAFVFSGITAESGTLVHAYYNNDVLSTVTTETVAITEGTYKYAKNPKAGLTEKCFLWNDINSTNGLNPLATATDGTIMVAGDGAGSSDGTVNTTGTIGTYKLKVTVGNPGKTSSKTIEVNVAKYAEVGETDDASVVVDVSKLANYSADTKYLVTTATADGKLVDQKDNVAHADGKITVDMTGAKKYEVSPIYSYTSVSNVSSGFEIPLSDGRYDFTFKKGNGSRADIYVNEIMVGNNVDQGSDHSGRNNSSGSYYTAPDVLVQGGKAVVRMDASSMSSITAKKNPSILTRKKHLYVLGDSLVANYQGAYADADGDGLPAAGDAQTGWGQVLDQYLTDEMNYTNIAESGNYAEGLYKPAFKGALASAEKGDYILIECGYNDYSYSTTAKMVATLEKMADECAERGVVLIMSTPNFGPLRGDTGSSARFGPSVLSTAAEKGVLGINLQGAGGAYYTAKGWEKDYWGKNFNVYFSGAQQDNLHLSYHGAMLHAYLVAQAIYDAQNDTENAELAATLADLKIDTSAHNLKDSEGNTLTFQVKASE